MTSETKAARLIPVTTNARLTLLRTYRVSLVAAIVSPPDGEAARGARNHFAAFLGIEAPEREEENAFIVLLRRFPRRGPQR